MVLQRGGEAREKKIRTSSEIYDMFVTVCDSL